MTGCASSIISPSSVTSTRSTPWVAGCWGCRARSALSRRMMPTPVPSAAWKAAPPTAASPPAPRGPPFPPRCSIATVLLPRFLAPWPDLGLPGHQGELLAQREALELLRQEQLGQVRVAVEDHAEQLGGLTLVPVGARPQVVHGRQVATVARHHAAHLDVMPVAGGIHVQDHPDASRLLVHAAEEVEEVAGEVHVAAHELGHAAPVAAGDRDRQQTERDLGCDRVLSKLRDQVVAQGLGVHLAPTGVLSEDIRSSGAPGTGSPP